MNFEHTGRWYTGTSFLSLPETEWPHKTIVDASDGDLEVIQLINAINSPVVLFKFDRLSTVMRAVRTAAYVLRFVDRYRPNVTFNKGEFTAAELDRAESLCLANLQSECFANEMRLIVNNKPLTKTSKLFKMCPQLDRFGVLRVRGRLDNLIGDENYKNPAILEANQPYCVLLLQQYHNRFDHQNEATVLNELRQKIWAVGARRALRRLKQTCGECRIRKAAPETQLMGQLPRVRLDYGAPSFTHTGVDYFGPIEVAVGRRREKRYGVLFTCMTCRAVHHDVAASVSTDSFLMAWRRFVSRRGVPKQMFSDSGTHFRGANAEMGRAIKELDNDAVKVAGPSREVTWNFIPPGSPHFGGCWEHMVRAIKSSLAVTLRNRRPPSVELLQTLLVEAENVVNAGR